MNLNNMKSALLSKTCLCREPQINYRISHPGETYMLYYHIICSDLYSKHEKMYIIQFTRKTLSKSHIVINAKPHES
jgi:hypothetical protein